MALFLGRPENIKRDRLCKCENRSDARSEELWDEETQEEFMIKICCDCGLFIKNKIPLF